MQFGQVHCSEDHFLTARGHHGHQNIWHASVAASSRWWLVNSAHIYPTAPSHRRPWHRRSKCMSTSSVMLTGNSLPQVGPPVPMIQSHIPALLQVPPFRQFCAPSHSMVDWIKFVPLSTGGGRLDTSLRSLSAPRLPPAVCTIPMMMMMMMMINHDKPATHTESESCIQTAKP
jgi:hypothetical protein